MKQEPNGTCNIQCAISGVTFSASHMGSIYIPASAGYFHPVFAASYTQLHALYTAHCKGKLNTTDSYLLFLAFLHSSEQIEWAHHATLSPTNSIATRLVENNLSQLIAVLEKSAVIEHPHFYQPSYKVTKDNSTLATISVWIADWQDNIDSFLAGKVDERTFEALKKVENRLSYLILSGEKPEKFSPVIASWASKTAEFPPDKDQEWQKVIRSCFSINKMFNTPLALLKEIKEYCECNIEVGSIHFHTLHEVLREGIKRHTDYLGGSSLALGYTLLEATPEKEAELKGDAEVAAIAANAPNAYPQKKGYPDSLSFLKAKLAYRVGSYAHKAGNKTKPIDLTYDYKTTGRPRK